MRGLLFRDSHTDPYPHSLLRTRSCFRIPERWGSIQGFPKVKGGLN